MASVKSKVSLQSCQILISLSSVCTSKLAFAAFNYCGHQFQIFSFPFLALDHGLCAGLIEISTIVQKWKSSLTARHMLVYTQFDQAVFYSSRVT